MEDFAKLNFCLERHASFHYQSQICKAVYLIEPAIKYALAFQSNLRYVLCIEVMDEVGCCLINQTLAICNTR